jgi:uncharacterized protein (DUF4415 family)
VKLDEDDAPELTDEWYKNAKRGREALEEIFGKKGAEALISGKVGRPKAENPKKLISFRFDPVIVGHLKGKVKGYNRRVEALILEAMEQGRI